jgi:hypothetical protein
MTAVIDKARFGALDAAHWELFSDFITFSHVKCVKVRILDPTEPLGGTAR